MEAVEMRPMTDLNVTELVGKKIRWVSEQGSGTNYSGTVIITSLDLTKKNPIRATTFEGDNLTQAYIQDTGLEERIQGGWVVSNNNRCFTIGDDYREIFFAEI